MKRLPSIRGLKSKTIRINPADLALFREDLKGDPEWEEYGSASDSELVVLSTFFGRLHLQPDVFMLTTDAVQTLVNEAVRFSIAEVAGALGGVAQLKPDGTMTVARIESDSVATFPAKPLTVPQPLTVPRPALMH